MPEFHRTTGAGTAILAGAAGLVVGLLVNPARKLAVQGPTMLMGEWDEALAAEHKAALKVVDLMESTDTSNTARRKLHLAQLKHMIGKHAFQEENTVYATMRQRGLLEPAKHLNEEHGQIKRLLFELTEMPKDDPRWIGTVGELRGLLEPHMAEEERELFPKLRDALNEDENAQLTKAMNKEGLKLA